MNMDLMLTFLELGDATSRNLGFSHRDNVWVNYGEETITETNLMEIVRRHPQIVRISTFPKQTEAKNGADWEWHIVGSKRTLSMRVQAKRIQRNGALKVKHIVKSSGKKQRDLLIAGAKAENMKPVYCIYCTEPQRTRWKTFQPKSGCWSFEMGCLLAGAEDVPDKTTKLNMIEKKCWPWHHLFSAGVPTQRKPVMIRSIGGDLAYFFVTRYTGELLEADDSEDPLARIFQTKG
ncbi:MAG: hypothetical protein OXF74_13695 [Rhodobacteraceae bacterium]|nr:hypothetical protein [Paracoccaceae bacterium]